jgi:hypothetical protein
MATKDLDHDRSRLNDNIRGALVVVLGSAALVGLAFAAMVVLTSPEGWATKAAQSAMSGEPASTSLITFGAGEASRSSKGLA